MKTLKQLLRQPLKNLSGILLITFAVTTLCIGAGQAVSTEATARMLEDSFTSIVVPSPKFMVTQTQFSTNMNLEEIEQASQWTLEMAQTHPDIIKTVSRSGLASAYISELVPVSYYENDYYDKMSIYVMDRLQPTPYGAPYSCAMFEITLEEIGEPQELRKEFSMEEMKSIEDFSSYDEWFLYRESMVMESFLIGYCVELTGKIVRVLSLGEHFKDPTGMWIRLRYTAKTLEELEALVKLELGGRYLVYGMDYYDADWDYRQRIKEDALWGGRVIEGWDMNKFRLPTDREREILSQSMPHLDLYIIYDGVPLSEYQYRNINAVSMTIETSAYDLIQYDDVRDENGNFLEVREITERTLTDAHGASVTVSAEEYGEYYKIPSIVALEGSAEEFLASEEGTAWQAALERDTINNHAFPVMGVDALEYAPRFTMGESQIVAGREFTDEELASGAPVCVISQELAEVNGLTLGDTIQPNFYNADEDLPYQNSLAESNGVINPAAAFYFSTTPLLGEKEYTIVGIYRSDEPWAEITNEKNLYAFTPNTIFVPKNSVPSKMQYSGLLQFQTVVLRNGCMDEFTDLMNKAGYAGCYLPYDQGYNQIAGNFSDYEVLSRRVMVVCVATYGVIALLYLLLFPGSQGKSLQLMENMGATRRQKRCHVLMGSICLLVPAAVLGVGAGIILWDRILGHMRLSAGIQMEMALDVKILTCIAVTQLLLMILLSATVGTVLARPRRLSQRR